MKMTVRQLLALNKLDYTILFRRFHDDPEIENCYEEYIAVVRSSNEAGMAPFLDEEIDYYDFRRKDSKTGGAWHEKWELDMLQISDLVITLK
jgi:hypothetical protein